MYTRLLNCAKGYLIMGKVYLVGAGPGDPELLTLKAKRLLVSADVVLYDYLAHPNLLLYCKKDALLINVGKRKGHHSKKQQEINTLLVDYAKHHKIVVRLKGGDPCVFGRVGEEMATLKENGIVFEIVPGITSAIAVPAYAGIPVTHRNYSRSFAVVTASPQEGDSVESIHIPNADTLIFLMPVTNSGIIAKRLLSEIPAFNADTPAVFIHRGTTAKQKVYQATLGTIEDVVKKENIQPPSLLLVGKVAALSKTFNWTEELPLFGQRIILLRSIVQGQDWAMQLQVLGAEAIQVPMIETIENTHLTAHIYADSLLPFTHLIFTSPNAVRITMQAIKNNHQDARILFGKTIICVGKKTADVLEEFGVLSDNIPDTFDQEGILSMLPKDLSQASILLPTSSIARDVLPNELKARGAEVSVWPVYDTVATSQNNVEIQDGDWVVFTSSSTADNFFKSALWKNQEIKVFSLGSVTNREIQKHWHGEVITAETSSFDAVCESMLNFKRSV